MNLEAEVASLHRIQEIEADGEFPAETRVHLIAQQSNRLLVY
jgi:hypothetical protein